MDWLDYRDALGIGFSDYDKTKFFLTKIFNYIDNDSDSTRNQIDEKEYGDFCNTTGSKFFPSPYCGEGYSKILRVLNANSHSLQSFLAYYIAFLNCQKDNQNKSYRKEDYKNLLCNMLQESHIPYDIRVDKDGYFVFPKGAEELDAVLVSQPLEWLRDYPNAYETYCIALRQYADGIYIRDVADNLRKALEAFLQEFLHNDKNLETNKNEICKYLGSQNVDAGIGGLFQPLINAYKNINDRIAKHNGKVDKKMLEFLLYQTGVLIRMVLTVKQAEAEEPTDAD